ncbi:hypothetical protein EJV46_10265 [Roseococcus sp. SYP-B2431]|uniref:hypothetical protein n=1 Tax=Roseococcus sp. SYP-B2431 TaxID=2496640 RepID=UPI00103EDDAB|nr:hypothetical protein [Roseococcus sp. SYP-B2431]TCH98928.1 hypothetical protein EJV46_10265 [Roseococcus sp. SYP-B2431]
MQNRYVGDIGDYMKLALLRTLLPDRSLGVAWWLYPDENHNSDGRHISYLDQPLLWRSLDPPLFDHLKAVVASGMRQVAALEHEALLPGARFFSEPMPTVGSRAQRREARLAWFERLQHTLEDCDLLFLDPDNGLETKNFDLGAPLSGKSVALSELRSLRRPGRTLISYHHQTRRPGGHAVELDHWGARLRAVGFAEVDAVRAGAYSPRAFFLLDADVELRDRASGLVERGGKSLSWHPKLSPRSSGKELEGAILLEKRSLDQATSTRHTISLCAKAAATPDLPERGRFIKAALLWYEKAAAFARRVMIRSRD